jgi:hypothetical protein
MMAQLIPVFFAIGWAMLRLFQKRCPLADFCVSEEIMNEAAG